MDEEAKVGTHAVLDKCACTDEPLKAMFPRFGILIEMRFWKMPTITPVSMLHVVILRKGRPRIVGEIDTNYSVASSQKCCEFTCCIKILTDKFRAFNQSRFVPDTTFVVDIRLMPIILTYAWPATVSSWREEGMNPQFIVYI